MSNVPDGWTEDLSVPLPPGRTVAEITTFVLENAIAKVAYKDMIKAIEDTFGLSPDDAELVCDRVFGGVVRASTGNVANQPDPVNDPFAHASFQQAQRDPAIIAALRP